MIEDLEYRAVLFSLIGGGVAASAWLARRVERRHGTVPRSADGPSMSLLVRCAALLFYGSLIAYVIHPPLMAWGRVPLPAWARWTGAGLVAGGAALALCARLHLAGSSTTTAIPRAGARLITSGPYRWIRHPVYAAGLLLIPGATMLSANLLVFSGGVAVTGVLLVRTRREEALLSEKFGAAYHAYRGRTGRLLPRMW